MSNNKKNFHHGRFSKNVIFDHFGKGSNIKKFATKFTFPIYLNAYFKLRLPEQNFDRLSLKQQLYELSSNAKWFQWSQEYLDYHTNPIDLEWSYIVTDQKLFAEQLITVLDTANVTYTHNEDTIFSAIEIYKRSLCHQEFVGNLDSLVWIAWCWGRFLELQDLIVNEFCESMTLRDLSKLVESRNSELVEYTKQFCVF